MQVQDVPAAHTGFLNRARGVPIQQLYKLAKGLKKRLVLTGHGPHMLCMHALHSVWNAGLPLTGLHMHLLLFTYWQLLVACCQNSHTCCISFCFRAKLQC